MWRSHRKLLWTLRRSFCSQAQQSETKNVTQFHPNRPEIFMQDLLDRESPLLHLSNEKAERGPFLKQIFQKHFDERFLTFPEVLDNQRVEDINELYEKVKAYVNSLAPRSMDNGPPREVMEELKSLGVFKILMPYSEGGYELTMTEMARVMEAFGTQPSLASIIATHNVAGIRTLVNYASPAQRSKFLPRLCSGEPVVAFAIDEETFRGSNATATIDASDYCTLNGKKIFVKNGERAEVFVVMCDLAGDEETGEAALLVDRNLPGVVVQSSPETLGLKGSGLTTVYFNDVKVPLDCVLGEKGSRSKVAQSVANTVRCALSAAAIGTSRAAFDLAFQHTFKTERFKTLLCAFQSIRGQLGRMALDLFAMESCVYLTLAIEDVVDKPDTLMESVATAIISMDASKRVIDNSGDIFGTRGMRLNHDVTRWLDDIVSSPFLFSSLREHSMSLAKVGLQSAAKKVAEGPQRSRWPAPLPDAVSNPLRRFLGAGKKTPHTDGKLQQFLHPSIIQAANILDYAQTQFGLTCEKLLQTFGEDALHNEIVLQHVSKITPDIFALSNTCARSSRSYCIGIYNSYEEVKLATVFSRLFLPRFEGHLKELNAIVEKQKLPSDNAAALAFFDAKRYCIAHPIRRPPPKV